MTISPKGRTNRKFTGSDKYRDEWDRIFRGPIDARPDPSMPEGVVAVRQGGELRGRIENLDPRPSTGPTSSDEAERGSPWSVLLVGGDSHDETLEVEGRLAPGAQIVVKGETYVIGAGGRKAHWECHSGCEKCGRQRDDND